MTLFWHQTGPVLRYVDGTLHIGTLNPEAEYRWRMSRSEMLKTGFMFLIAAVLPWRRK